MQLWRPYFNVHKSLREKHSGDREREWQSGWWYYYLDCRAIPMHMNTIRIRIRIR